MNMSLKPQRVILLEAVRGLVAEARSARAQLPAVAAERRFLLGVEAAAMEVLHPELGAARREGWLDLEPPVFRDGYLQAGSMLAAAMTAPETPFRLLMPTYEEVG